jgi:acyl-coenzyme A synthetase/AMP-(fatty) acid ligase
MALVARLVDDHVVAGRAHDVCLTDDAVGAVTYGTLAGAVRCHSARLRARGLVPGTRGLIISDDSVAAVVTLLALCANGCVPVPVSPMLTDEEIAFIAGDCGATLVHYGIPHARREALRAPLGHLTTVTAEQATDALHDGASCGAPALLRESEHAEQEVLLQYTSGSTGRHKGVRQSLRGLLGVIDGYGRTLPLKPDDVVLSTAKLSFGFGFGSSVLWTLAAGAQAVLLSGAVDAFSLIAALRRHRPTVLCTVPRMYAMLLEHVRDPADLASVRLGVSAGEHLPDDLSARFTARFATPLVNALGATEVGHIVLVANKGPGQGAVPVSGVTATVRDETGTVVADGEAGRLHIAGPSTALGYLNRPEDGRRVFADGGVYTGDIVRRTAEGRFFYLCRADDLINIGGHKISPAEIETVVGGVAGVRDCAVAVAADKTHGLAQAIAYVVPKDGKEPDLLRRAVQTAIRRELATYKRPARVEVVDALPVTSTGKLARFKLRQRVEQP